MWLYHYAFPLEIYEFHLLCILASIWYCLYIVKKSVLPKAVYRLQSYQNPNDFFFVEIEKSILKFVWNLKGPQIAKAFLEKKKKNVGGLTLADFKIYYYSATVIKIMWFWHRQT